MIIIMGNDYIQHLTLLNRESNNVKVGWRKAWTWVRSLTEARGLSLTSEEEGDIFGRETVTSFWLLRNFLMLNFYRR